MIFKILANYGPLLLAAMGQTLLLALWSLFFACLIGLFVGILSVLKSRVCNIIATIFVDIIRGVPMIVLAFFVYFGVPMLMNDNLNWAAMTGSKFITGIYAEADLDKLVSDTGMSLRQTLQSLSPYGPDGKTIVYNTGGLSQEALQNVRWDFDQVQTMLELHIEQGPVLDREGLSLGIVDSIFGMRVIEVTLTGVGNHAGATPMTERYDALCTAAECILAAEAHVKTDDDKRTVVTCGKMDIEPNCSNVIPETVRFSLEVRDKDETKIDRFMNEIIDLIVAIAEKRQVNCEIKEHSKSSPLHLTDRLIDAMSKHAAALDLPYKVMDSGAVHDACMIAKYAQTGMIFVPSINGRSHVPEENTNDADIAAGVQFLLDTVLHELHEVK